MHLASRNSGVKRKLVGSHSTTESLGLDALVEVHGLGELNIAVKAGVMLRFVYNRDLHSLEVDLSTSFNLARHKPEGCLLVSESGISSAEEIERLSEAGFDGFLIGEALMTSGDPSKKLAALAAAGGSRG